MKDFLSKLVLVCFFSMLGIYTWANTMPDEMQQAKTVRGVVIEQSTNEPLVGASVYVRGTTVGTTTNVDGQYQLNVPSEDAVLVFSFLGKRTIEQPVRGMTVIDVAMEDDATMLDELVYTGYMTQRKADITGSVAMANADDLIKNPSANAMKALQGKLSGVHITVNGGNPAENVNIQVRGLSSLSGGVRPLIVLDGMPTENLNLRDINTGDIESIQVLKDAASASIYGHALPVGSSLSKPRRDGKDAQRWNTMEVFPSARC